jgi:hypothetical protein
VVSQNKQQELFLIYIIRQIVPLLGITVDSTADCAEIFGLAPTFDPRGSSSGDV